MYWDNDYYSYRNINTFRNAMPNLKSLIRLFHASPTAPSVDVYANGNLIAKDLAFSKFTNYIEVSPGEYKIEIFPTGTKENLVITKTLEVAPNSIFTVAAVNLPANLDLLVIKDASGAVNPNISFLRFISLSTNAPLLDLSIGTNKLFKMVEYKEITGYYPLSPGIYTFDLAPSGVSALTLRIPDVNLRPNKFYTIYAIGIVGGTPSIQSVLIQDGIR
ncbi:hypothetical protein CPJCM30710_01360 [Clostridium polyendosporum]|uniref:DUF4397 domain-containing protein n=1 Tax=Clostridium polyendosporum TaxID=69208 RepID=A0A919RVY0_9CLOT|nr:DUF4397 domain-containing protein [Clostridium polyendosporum]GIM27470.1 hypothetical protein CPJCM30710_01360 [Clostridium polyendosporum]